MQKQFTRLQGIRCPATQTPPQPSPLVR